MKSDTNEESSLVDKFIQSQTVEDDLPPPYPQNPAQFEGYQNIGIVTPSVQPGFFFIYSWHL
jgi:hypothetical protein